MIKPIGIFWLFLNIIKIISLELAQFSILKKSYPQKGIMIQNLSKNLTERLEIKINNQIFQINQQEQPYYQKFEFFVQEGLDINISLIGMEFDAKNLKIEGWLYPQNVSQAFIQGCEQFSYQYPLWQYIAYDNLSEFYDQPKRPQTHFSAMKNWINDPNGLIKFQDRYHLFYQYDPFNLKVSGLLFWGHAVSFDGVYWKHQPPALYPNISVLNQSFQVGGIFSGSAFPFDQLSFQIYYTDHYQSEKIQIETQYTINTKDGINFGQPQQIISDRPQTTTPDIRDPQVTYNNQSKKYELILGTNFDSSPSVIQYSSLTPKGPWSFDKVIYQGKYLPSTTIECPNKFNLIDKANGKEYTVLVFSINDIKIQSSYTLYVIGVQNENGNFQNITDIKRMDFGGHFYATQVFPQQGNQYAEAITWMQNWNKPDKYFGDDIFSGIMSYTKIMTLNQLKLYQQPIDSIRKLRTFQILNKTSVGPYKIEINELSEIEIQFPQDFDILFKFQFKQSETKQIQLLYQADLRQFTFVLQENNDQIIYQSDRLNNIEEIISLQIYIDRGAIEIYCNKGEATFSERIMGNKLVNQSILFEIQQYFLTEWSLNIWNLDKIYK